MIYHTDGFTIGGNPSDIGGGFTIFAGGQLLESIELKKKNFTNNEGELLGVLYALMYCNSEDVIITDSKNTMAWIKSGKPKARPDLKEYARLAKQLQEFKKVEIKWQPRETNLAGHYNETRRPTNSGLRQQTFFPI